MKFLINYKSPYNVGLGYCYGSFFGTGWGYGLFCYHGDQYGCGRGYGYIEEDNDFGYSWDCYEYVEDCFFYNAYPCNLILRSLI